MLRFGNSSKAQVYSSLSGPARFGRLHGFQPVTSIERPLELMKAT